MDMRGFPDYRARARFRRFLFSKTVAVLLAGLFILFAQAAWGMHQKSVEANNRMVEAQEELAALQRRGAELRADIERLSNERGIEEEIRTRFMMAKDGEEVLVIRGEHRGKNGESVFVPDERGYVERLLGAVGLSGQ
jgi:cell division protein FtsB